MSRLDRIVIDECHSLLNDEYDFRSAVQLLDQLVGQDGDPDDPPDGHVDPHITHIETSTTRAVIVPQRTMT